MHCELRIKFKNETYFYEVLRHELDERAGCLFIREHGRTPQGGDLSGRGGGWSPRGPKMGSVSSLFQKILRKGSFVSKNRYF